MVPVGIPVPVGIALGGYAIYHEIALVVTVKSADDVQKGRLPRTALAENGDEFAVAKADRHPIQRLLDQRSRTVDFTDALDLEHADDSSDFFPVRNHGFQNPCEQVYYTTKGAA